MARESPAGGPGRALDVAPGPAAVREILFLSDLSPQSDLAFDHARLLAERLEARLTLLHVVEDVPEADGHRTATPEEVRSHRASELARQHLAWRAEGLKVASRLVVEQSESPAAFLTARLRSLAPDLLVATVRGRRPLLPLLFGTVASALLHETTCPVLCLREPDHGAALPYRRVVVATDLSEGSRRAFPVAAAIAGAFDAEVVAVHAAAVAEPRSLSGVPDLVESRLPSPRAVVDFLHPDLLGLRVVADVGIGSPWTRIAEVARERKADVVVVAAHAVHAGTRTPGPHVEDLVRRSPCPVLVV